MGYLPAFTHHELAASPSARYYEDLLEQSALAGKEDEQLPPGIRA